MAISRGRRSTRWLFVTAFVPNERSPPNQTIENHVNYQMHIIFTREIKLSAEKQKTFNFLLPKGHRCACRWSRLVIAIAALEFRCDDWMDMGMRRGTHKFDNENSLNLYFVLFGRTVKMAVCKGISFFAFFFF